VSLQQRTAHGQIAAHGTLEQLVRVGFGASHGAVLPEQIPQPNEKRDRKSARGEEISPLNPFPKRRGGNQEFWMEPI
jgi:hypothetical protein